MGPGGGSEVQSSLIYHVLRTKAGELEWKTKLYQRLEANEHKLLVGQEHLDEEKAKRETAESQLLVSQEQLKDKAGGSGRIARRGT